MNPPYGRSIGRWMKKAWEASRSGATVVCLVPARTDTKWWHDFAMRGEIKFLKGRLKFGGCTKSAPFPSAIVVFKPPVRKATDSD
jgi:site-specific DNA-methyltransferase (adenine-specific)